jgi:hypothetical protein
MPTPKFILASLENALIAYLTSFVGMLIVSGNNGSINVSTLQAAAIAGLPAALSVVYSMLAGLKNGTASLLTPQAPVAPANSPVTTAAGAPAVQDSGTPIA